MKISKFFIAGSLTMMFVATTSCGNGANKEEEAAPADSVEVVDSVALRQAEEAEALKAREDSIAAAEEAAKAAIEEKKAQGIVGEITATNGTVYTLKSKGRWTANKGGIRTGRWEKEGQMIHIYFDGADGNCFYYNGGIYELGSCADINPKTMEVTDEEGNPDKLSSYKQTNATVEWL